jgi:signal peptidase I
MKGLIKDIAIALVIVIAVMLVIKPTIVKESSMEPTLYENNYLLVNKQAYNFGKEERGDIVVFNSDLKDDDGNDKLLIKRIVALSGDEITIADGELYVNGEKQQEYYIKEQGETYGDVTKAKVPEGRVFVMGDNRRVSIDSRAEEVGFIHKDRLVGKAFVRLYPFNKIGGLYQ